MAPFLDHFVCLSVCHFVCADPIFLNYYIYKDNINTTMIYSVMIYGYILICNVSGSTDMYPAAHKLAGSHNSVTPDIFPISRW